MQQPKWILTEACSPSDGRYSGWGAALLTLVFHRYSLLCGIGRAAIFLLGVPSACLLLTLDSLPLAAHRWRLESRHPEWFTLPQFRHFAQPLLLFLLHWLL